MEAHKVVKVQPLSETAFAPFGRAVARKGAAPPDMKGEGWRCWFPLGELADPAPLEIGLVQSDPQPLLLKKMERHRDREEWVFALDRPLVQTVSLSAPSNLQSPDPSRTQAFILQPGEGVILARGTWHAPGLPAGDRATLYGFVLGRSGSAAESEGWVWFAQDVVIQLEL
jgi:ureidoglycolate lyase